MRRLLLATVIAVVLIVGPAPRAGANAEPAWANAQPQFLPTGQLLTPTAAPGATFLRLTTGLRADGTADANGAVAAALSPDGTALLVLTSGYNTGFFEPNGSPIVFTVPDPISGKPSGTQTPNGQWIFVYDVRGTTPLLRARITVPNTYCGLSWTADGRGFVVSGGADDRVYVFAATGSKAAPAAEQRYALAPPEILLGHNSGATQPIPNYDGGLLAGTVAGGAAGTAQYLTYGFGAVAAGLAITPDGQTLYVANIENDSLSVVDLATRRVVRDIHFFLPGGRVAVGEFPFAVAVVPNPRGAAGRVYVTSLRDGQVLSVDPHSGAFTPIAVGGEPNALLVSRDRSTLYVANGDDDSIDVIDVRTDRLVRVISLLRPGFPYKGANPNALAESRDGRTLYVTLGGENALAVVDIGAGIVRGRIPTGWEPSGVATSVDGQTLYVVNTRSNSGPTGYAIDQYDDALPLPDGANGYVYALEKAALLALPVPGATALTRLSATVDRNNGFVPAPASPLMRLLAAKIHHVIYVMRENRTYDQILGDLGEGNGAPQLAEFPWPITPNAHRLAQQFVDLDNFYDSGDVSGDGWNWTFQGHANDYTDKSVPVNYGNGGFTFDWNGSPRNLNVSLPEFGFPTLTGERTTTLLDPSGSSNIEPGPKDITATEGDSDDRPQALGGYIWDTILRTGQTHRHYGAYADEIYYTIGTPLYLPIDRHAFADRAIQAIPLRPSLHGRIDSYYRGWDLNVPDGYRFEEWKREFDSYARSGGLPNLEVVCLMMDHFGNFGTNVGGLNSANTQIADNDYALGRLVEAVSHSRYWNDTAIFVIEDDAQDGPDHVDSHRSVGFVISAYTKRRAVVSTRYTTVSMLRTIEDFLGAAPLGLNDANAVPMADVFTSGANLQPYDAVIPGNLCRAPVNPNLVPACADPRAARTAALAERQPAGWWQAQTAGFDFGGPDRVDPRRFNRIIWRGQMGDGSPYLR
jgi:YVTN family beta-propeller protein